MPEEVSRLTPAADPSRAQWRLESMQLANWGGFHGLVTIAMSPASTLISGASGTGKSTILDAWLALMMDSNTPFNGASNDAGRGRARGATQRSLLTYLRGKLDDIREDGELGERNLRGSSATWGAVAATFVDSGEQRFSALRLFYVPRSASRDTDISRKLCTVLGPIDVKDFEPLAAGRFEKREVEGRHPALKVHGSYEGFAVAVRRRLGIGSGDEGASALRLLARIQAGTPVTSVDRLYKDLVLEEPTTFAAADRAIDHFAHLEAAHSEMATSAAKQKCLEEVPALWADHQEQLTRAELVAGMRLDDPTSPLGPWAAAEEVNLATSSLRLNQTAQEAQRSELEEARRDEDTLRSQAQEVEAAIDAAGGGELKEIASTIVRLDGERDEAQRFRDAFDDRTQVLNLNVSSEVQFAEASEVARQFLESGQRQARDQIRTARQELDGGSWPLRQEARELEDERTSLRTRDGQVPPTWHQQRLDAARAADLDPGDLPFVAELIDMRPEHVEWRTAAELTFRPVAQVMLVEARHLDRLSRAIDSQRWSFRIHFEGVEPRSFAPQPRDDGMLSGKLDYRPTRFTNWVQERLTREGTDALCVPSTSDLNGPGRRVTKSGQTRHGRRGAHGGAQRPIIGFDSTRRLADIELRLGELVGLLDGIQAKLDRLGERERALDGVALAHTYVSTTRWSSIDHDSLSDRIEGLQARRLAILQAGNRLEELERQLGALNEQVERAARRKFRAEGAIEGLESDEARLTERLEELAAQASDFEAEERAVTPEQAHAFSEAWTATEDHAPYTPEQFGARLARLIAALRKDQADAARNVERVGGTLRRIFDSYLARWPDPNLGVEAVSAPDYIAILDDITATGLHERRQEWVRRINAWTGEDLLPLHMAFDTSIEDIVDRLAPVNDILANLPFGAHRDRLRINLRRLTHERQTTFRKTLKALSSGATSQLTMEQADAKFAQIRTFIESIRPSSDGGSKNDRIYHLDVRKHIELSAEVVADDGAVRAEYTTLGGKSGGETQELVAFIVGAALRFHLGDPTTELPTFAPVLLDEGFVKADSEFAGRGVQAWLGLGFQLIVAAPFDKVTALERHVDQILQVTKNPTTGRARVIDLTRS